jgi:hypothetical protein
MQSHVVFALIFFLIGSALHTLAQIDAIARSKNNPNNSRLGIFLGRWQPILIRTIWTLVIFTLWLQGQLVAVLTAAKIPVPDTLTGILDLHIGGAVAFIAGYFLDSMLAFIPGLKNSVPAAFDSTTGAAMPPPPAVPAKIDTPPPKA